mmetsp:Transcript_167523/g.407270  ORF Transcript_167523/g.407270 Transcript_167523/m.407270 type:complete len:598 (+) Transcript_167523:84-1877(+)
MAARAGDAAPAAAPSANEGELELDFDETPRSEMGVFRRWMGDSVVRPVLTVLGIACIAVTIAVLISINPAAEPHERRLEVPERVSLEFTSNFKDDNEYWGQGEYTGAFFKEEQDDGTWAAHGYYYSDREGVRSYMFYWDDSVSYRQEVLETGEVLRAGCLSSHSIMPEMTALRDSLSLAEPVASEDIVGVDVSATCENGQSYVVRFEGDDFILCDVLSTDGSIEALFGENFETVVTKFHMGDKAVHVLNEAPVDMDGNVLECPKLSTARHDHADDADHSRALRSDGAPMRSEAEISSWWKETEEAKHGRRLSGSKTCVFMHGAGYTSDEAVDTTSFTQYWGNAHTHATNGNHCSASKLKFIRRDTTSRSWDDLTLQQHFCDVAAGGHSGQTISDTWVFSHDFGSLVVAGAIQSGLCSFASSSKWHQIDSPWDGANSEASATAGCQNFPDGDASWEDLNNQLGFCSGTGTDRTPTQAWLSMAPTFVGDRQSFSSITSTLRHNNINGGMCGHDPYGISSNCCLAYMASSDVLNLNSYNDGVLETSNCKLGEHSSSTTWGSSYTHDYYNAHVNILDSTCRNGNGAYGNDKKPCYFFRYAG